MFSSSKQRSTYSTASTWRMLARNWFPQAFALRRAPHQAGDVDELEGGVQGLLGLRHLGDLIEPGVGHRHHADVGSMVAKG